MNVVVRDKEAYHQQTTERMNKHFELSNWSVQQKLALTCRTLAAEGHDSGLAGQATARGERPGTYYMLIREICRCYGNRDSIPPLPCAVERREVRWLHGWPG
jgi:hypothetical protein